jgi:hypothetical protein
MPQVTVSEQPSGGYPSTLRGFLQAVRDTVNPTESGTGFEGPRSAAARLEPLVQAKPTTRKPNETLQILDTAFFGTGEVNRTPQPPLPGEIRDFVPLDQRAPLPTTTETVPPESLPRPNNPLRVDLLDP